jgi:Domain of unknown function (DUF4157)
MTRQAATQTNQQASAMSPLSRGGILQRKCEECGQHTIAGGECGECGKKKIGLQRKLTIGASNDPLELEADRVADQVMSAPANSAITHSSPRIQRFAGQASGRSDMSAPASVDRVLSSPGRPLDSALQQDMGQRFGHDFSRVRIHTDAEAAASASVLQAQAYTVGNDVVFNANKFAPHSFKGRKLLVHELVHVIQQSSFSQKKIQKQSIHNPLFPCRETSQMPGGMDFFGTLVHLAIQQHYLSNIDPMAATEYLIPGSSQTGATGRADIVDSTGGIYEIKPLGLASDAFLEAGNYMLHAEGACDPHVNWHLGTRYFPKVPMVINDSLIFSWLLGPGVIVYTRSRVPTVPVPVPVPEKLKEPGKVKDRGKRLIPPEQVPVLAFEVLLGAAFVWAAKKLGGRAAAPAMVLLAIVLVANGAEASIGLEGDDAIDAMIKMAEQKGATVPDDLKDAIKKDPALRKILADAAKTGDKTAAQQKLGEELTRIVVENRDQFTEAELQELLNITEANQGQIPNGKLTVEEIKRTIEAKRKGAGAGSSSEGEGSGSSSAGGKKEDPTGKADQPGQAPIASATPKTPEERLVEGMASSEEQGPKFTTTLKEKLLAAIHAISPPLSDKEVDELLKYLGSGSGKSEEEIVESIRQGITTLRTGKSGSPSEQNATDPSANQKLDSSDKSQSEQTGIKVNIDKMDPTKSAPKDAKEMIEAANKLIARIGWIKPDRSHLIMRDLAYEIGKTYSLILIGHDEYDVPYVGYVAVTIHKKNIDSWDVTIAGGAVLYTKDRRYGVTRLITDKLVPPKSLLGREGSKK